MTMNRRNMLLGAGGAFLSCALPSWAEETQIIGGPAFGSSWRAVLPTSADVQNVRVAIEGVVASVDDAMSPFRTSSEISNLNAAKDMNWHPVSDGAGKVIAESLRIARLTDGAFDPTVGPIVGRYGFGPITGSTFARYRSIELVDGKLRKAVPDATLDLCGIAKGHALDRMTDLLTEQGVSSFQLEAGGEVLARGLHPSGRQWQVAIETPGASPQAFQRIVKLDGMALATSGNAVNGGQEGRISFSHIINPRTELPVANGVASVSVIAETAMESDALATAFMAMGLERGVGFAEQEGIAVLFQSRDATEISETMSAQFSRYIAV